MLSCCAALAAQDPPQLPAPAGYRGPDAVLARLQELAAAGACQLIPLARTPAGRELAVAAFGESAAPGRPALLLVADPDGDRPAASEVALRLAEALAAGAPLLEQATVYLLPVANPDAAARAFAGAPPRRGRPVDEDHDGRLDEDPAEDLDGDGIAVQMRVPDPTGEWRAAAADPRAMVKAKREQGEAGAFRLLREGRDDDGDREYNEDESLGVAWNANWPHRFGFHAPNAGPHQLSEPETRALAEFVLSHRRLALVVVLGGEDNLSQPPEGGEDSGAAASKPLREDAKLLSIWSKRWLEDDRNQPRGGERGAGTFAEWAYFQAGLPVIQSALWSPPLDRKPEEKAAADATEQPAEAKAEDKKPKLDEEEKLLLWNDQVLGGAGFVPWRAFEHPQLGTVEIGGWKPLARDNPPAGELDALAKLWLERLNTLQEDWARLRWEQVEVRALDGEVFEARATLVNLGLLATVCQMGEATQRLRPLRVALELPAGGQLLAGQRLQSAGRLHGLGGKREFRWLYRAPDGAPAQLRASSDTAGEAVTVLEVNR